VQVTGELGSPSATTTLPGNQLPPPAPKFGGVINDDAMQSKEWWPPRVVPPKDAPNILLILTDDAGFGFYLLKGKPVFLWNLLDLERIKWEGPEALAPGQHTLEFDFKYDGLGVGTMAYNSFAGIGQGGTGTLKVDGKVVATQKMEKTIPIILQWDESFDIGSDTITGVNDADYQPPFELTAQFNKLTITIDRPQLSPEEIKKLEEGLKKLEAGRE
jgi:arylsulfatase